VEMERGDQGEKVSLAGAESKHYFNATVVSNACAVGVAGKREEETGGSMGKEERGQSRGAEARRVQLSPPLCASPSGTTVKHYQSATFVSKGEGCGLLLARRYACDGSS
jgi:hypothetical protein